MAQHKNQARSQLRDAVLDTSESRVIYDIARQPNDEQITDPLIEEDFRRHARIGAAYDDGERMLRGSDLFATLRCSVWAFRLTRDIVPVVGQQAMERGFPANRAGGLSA
jgi:hypothetical protein